MTLFARLLVVAAALPFVLATGKSGSSSCKSSEFYWGDSDCCLPYGGTKNPPSPPKGSSCPSAWEWSSSKNHCVPHQPPTSSSPSCSSGWGWNGSKKCCEEHATSTVHTTTVHTTTVHTSTVHTTTAHTTTYSAPTPSSSSSCGSNQWWWGEKECCLPHGGNPNPPKPPSGTDCPSNWDWHTGKKCCVPHHPNQPPPQCGSGWGWDNGSKCCFPHTSTTVTPTPSSKPGNPGYPGKGGHSGWKRNHKARNVSLCPTGLEACPIPGLKGLTDDWECLDTANELESCGGCSSTGAGEDCTAIAGAWNVGCNNGKCVVYTCADGYLRSLDNKSCVKV
ncbi:hypothetical protein C8T65DRAFT_734168 [Cerioporus squamosus]|nr:hypothetical protein C8T65DRAFT_734168 [Cerioporus squamosus]